MPPPPPPGAAQEADLVLILQGRKGRYTSLDVRKNRYDGTLGKVSGTLQPLLPSLPAGPCPCPCLAWCSVPCRAWLVGPAPSLSPH